MLRHQDAESRVWYVKQGGLVTSTVYIVDDDTDVAQGLKWLLESIDLQCRIFNSSVAFLEQFDPEWHGSILLDVRMPKISGLEILQRLKERDNAMPIIIITGHADVTMAVNAMKGGAFDFIEKPINEELLIGALQKAMRQSNEAYKRLEEQRAIRKRLDRLTQRERQVIDLALEGAYNKRIAHSLKISVKTVESHRSRAMNKLGAQNLQELLMLTKAFPDGRFPVDE